MTDRIDHHLQDALEKQVDHLVEKWEGRIDEEAVADCVIGIFEDRACAINNGGLREQIEFLIGECGYEWADNTLNIYEVK